jgi:hypothetical protein
MGPATRNRVAREAIAVHQLVSEGGLELLNQAKHPGALQRLDLHLWVPRRSSLDTEMHPDTPECALGGIKGSITSRGG